VTGTALFRASAATSLTFHALLLLWTDGLQGGGDMKPHLRLIQYMAEDPSLNSVYPPAYHALGALVAPLSGLAVFPEWFAWCAAAALIAAFRFFQRAAGLPDVSAALFAWAPYGFALTRCLPKVEVAGYALAFAALGFLIQRRYAALGAALAATFLVHTAAALFLGLCAGSLALALRDARALLALAVGSLIAAPLPLAHVAAGCSPAQALLFSHGDYLRAAPRMHNLLHWDRVVVLANPIALVAAVPGVPLLWRRHRPIAVLCAVVTALYLNEIWLAPFGARTTLDLLRGLTIFAFPVTATAGITLAQRPAAAAVAVAGSAGLAVLAALLVVPAACVSKPIEMAEIQGLEVDRCSFRWRVRHPHPVPPRPQRDEIGPDRGVEETAPLEGATQ
jgi:hypothetical protein